MVRRWGWLLLGLLLASLVFGGPARAADAPPGPRAAGPAAEAQEKRIALVIGISAYQYAPELANPRNDARAMADALRKLNFTVEEKQDLNMRGFADALRQFGVQASQADVAVLYYAGHGIQVSGVNYLIPSEAQLERERDLVYEAMPLNLPLGELAQARKLGILILDACRNNPFVDRLSRTGSTRLQAHSGFGAVDDTPSDTLVAMATRADQLAEDGNGEHSPYTAALLQHLQTPGLELGLFFRNVRDTVKQATDGRQEPFTYGTLGATPFYFNPRPPNHPPVIGALLPLDISDRSQEQTLGIAQPTDLDDDPLFARVSGLPRGGAVRVGDRSVLIGDYLTVDQLAATSFKPDASFRGDAGSFDFVVMDGRGGVLRATVPVTIRPSNRAPLLVAERSLRVSPLPMRIEAPTDPDGDPLTITVTGVPDRGKVKNGGATVKKGENLSIEALTALTFDPERGSPGAAGTFTFTADDGKGGKSNGSVAVEIVEPDTPVIADVDAAAWQSVRDSSEPADFDAFLRLYGKSSYAPLARQQMEKLAAAKPPGTSPPAPSDRKPDEKHGAAEPSKDGNAVAEAPRRERYVAVNDVTVRAAPNNNAARVGRVPRGATVGMLERVAGRDWYQIVLDDGTKGFVYGPLIKPAPPDAAPKPEAAPPESAPSQSTVPESASLGSPPPGSRPSGSTVVAAAPPEPPPAAAAPATNPSPANPASTTPATNGAVRNHGPSNGFQDCAGCPVMLRLPGGSFTMGNAQGSPSERPVHRVSIAKPFALSAYEVTVAEWRLCVQGGGCTDMPRMTGAADSTPIHNVHWQDARAYVAWLSRKTGQPYRLPSEAEWEYAARGGTTGAVWWVGGPGDFAGCQSCGGPFQSMTPNAVGSLKANPFGLHDMNGGVAEWVEDCWNKDYAGAPADGSAWTHGTCSKRVLRGGSWRDAQADITDTARNSYDLDVRYLTNGFRVARDLN